MHRDVAAAAAGGPVAAASLACLMIDAAAFERAGGLKGEYSLSDYEGSDLSLRLAEMGLRVHYAPEAELFRLEGLGAEPEALGEAHARWLHSRLWADAIAGAVR
jgi:GT2 family glycosyltransferase